MVMKRPIVRLDNGIEVLKTTGDVDAMTHGGGVLYREPRYRDVYWTFWGERTQGQKNFEVFTAPVPDDVIEYFDPDMRELSIVSGFEPKELRKMGRSKNPIERLEVVEAIRDCSGPSRVDPSHTPEEVSPFEMAERWGGVFDISTDHIPMIEYEDYLVREAKNGMYECGCVDGAYLGRFEDFKYALCAVADHMKQRGSHEANLFHEHDFGKIELVSWEPETFIGKLPRRRGKLPEAAWRNLMKRYVRSESRKKGIDSRLKSQKQVTRQRKRRMSKHSQQARIERARALRKSSEEKYG
jgi:hypothetical protein